MILPENKMKGFFFFFFVRSDFSHDFNKKSPSLTSLNLPLILSASHTSTPPTSHSPDSNTNQKMDPGQYETPARRDLYEWCLSHRVSTSRGTPYPCDPYDLDECTFGSDRPPRSTHSRNSATANLENFLHPDAPIDSAVHAAVTRLRAALRIHDWKPDLVIKAFTDLDTVFFGGKLRGHTTIHWYGASWWMQHLRSPQGHNRFLGCTYYLDRRKARIHLNAWKILLDTRNAKAVMWGVMLHEMIVSVFFR